VHCGWNLVVDILSTYVYIIIVVDIFSIYFIKFYIA
jgi:hypothetical protein